MHLLLERFFNLKDILQKMPLLLKNATIIEVKIGVSFFIKMKGMMENELY